ncbi:phosphosulfolactate synthase, partial [Bacillus subtilis]
MNDFSLQLPVRTNKPSETGQSILIDNGYPLQFFKDVIAGASDYIEFVKFGWCTS